MNPYDAGTWVQAVTGDQPQCFGYTAPIQHIAAAGYQPNFVEDNILTANSGASPPVAPQQRFSLDI